MGHIFPHLAVWSVPRGLCGIQPHRAPTKARPYGANLKKQPTNNYSCTGTDNNGNAKEERRTAKNKVPFSALLLSLSVAVKRTPLKPSIKFIFNGVIKAFYLSDRREL